VTDNTLAMFGGRPVRTAPFATTAVVGHEEIAAVMDVFRANQFSRYAGGPSLNVEELLRLTSEQARTHPMAYWSFLGGDKVRAFEADFARMFESGYAIAVNSATTGIATALAAAGVGPGDEVIVTAMSFTATASAILMFGSIPVFVDVDPRTFCIDPAAVERAITPRTRAIVVVHLLGNAADMDAIMSIARARGLVVLEDACQAPLTKYRGRIVGTIGDFGVYSLQETKNIMTGEGGMIITGNQEFARRCRLIRNHGEAVPDEGCPVDDLIVGYNFRMTEITAALGVEQLKRLAHSNAVRNRNAGYLIDRLRALPGLTPPFVPETVSYQSHILAFLYDGDSLGVSRALVVKAIRDEGIPVGTGYLRLLYQNPIFLRRSAFRATGFPFSLQPASTAEYRHGLCPVAEDLVQKRFIWVYQINDPSTTADMADIALAFEKVWANLDRLRACTDDVVMEYTR
jgi:perosamine synthetase